jgi:peroxin-6
MHAAYQSLFLRGLKDYFGTMRRLVKQGDIIPVSINTDAAEEEFDTPGDNVDGDIIGRR